MSGFIAMSRDALGHPVIGDPERFYAWFWLVSNAAWKPTRARISGQVATLEVGELSFSVRFLAEAWGWSKSRVDRFLSELRQEGMIETCSKIGTEAGQKAGQGQSVITICNYAKYQDPKGRKRDSTAPNSGTAAGQQRDKEEQGNKGTIEPNGSNARTSAPEKPDDVSDDVWRDFKRHRAKHGGISDRVVAGFRREADKAGWPLERAMDESITQGWRGFKAEYVKGKNNGQSDKRDGATKALDRKLGLDEFAGQAGRQPDSGTEGSRSPPIPRIAAR